MTLRVAIVGCGKIADSHVQEIQKINCAQLSAVCDREPVIAEQLAIRYRIPRWYADLDQMLSKEQPDVLHIATPPVSHLYLTRTAVRAGCHVFVEKPLALSAADGRQLIDCAQDAGKKLSINHWRNFETPSHELRDLFRRGELGEPVHIESYCGYDLTGRFGQALLSDENHWVRDLPGKLFHNILDHSISSIVPFLPPGSPEVVARAFLRRALNNSSADSVLDELRVMIFAGAVSAYVTFCSHARPVGQFLHVYGTKQIAHVDFGSRTLLFDQSQTLPTALGRLLPPFKTSWKTFRQATRNVHEFVGARYHYFAGMNRLISAFYESILNDGPVPIPYSEILRVATIMDEIFAQVYPAVLA